MEAIVNAEPTEEEFAEYERRAPGWVVRCRRCGLTEPWGKYAVRLYAASLGKRTLRRCARCGRLCCHSIEKVRRGGR